MVGKVEILTQSEFAERMGVSGARISQLVKAKRLPTATDGKRVLWPAARDIFLAERADRQTTADSSRPRPRLSSQPRPDDDAGLSVRMSDTEKLTAARARKEAARARLAELDRDEREDSLIPVEEVRADAVVMIAAVRGALLALPSQVALRCEMKTAGEITDLLADEVNRILSEWHTGRWGRSEDSLP